MAQVLFLMVFGLVAFFILVAIYLLARDIRPLPKMVDDLPKWKIVRTESTIVVITLRGQLQQLKIFNMSKDMPETRHGRILDNVGIVEIPTLDFKDFDLGAHVRIGWSDGDRYVEGTIPLHI